MTDFETRLRDDLARLASSVPVSTNRPPAYVGPPAPRPPRRATGTSYVVVTLSIAVLVCGLVALAAGIEGSDRSTTAGGRTDDAPDGSDAEDRPPNETSSDRPDPTVGGVDAAAGMDEDFTITRGSPAAGTLEAHARSLLPDHVVQDSYEWTSDGRTVSVFVDLLSPNGARAKLAFYADPNPAHEELLGQLTPRLSTSSPEGLVSDPDSEGPLWVAADRTPSGGEVALMLMAPAGDAIGRDDLPSLLAGADPAAIEAVLERIARSY